MTPKPNEKEPRSTHTFNRECPVCKGFCKHAQVNSLTPYEEIEAEIRRKRRLQGF
jgi:C4-type Zn-finger protein